jgi:tetratricopeptide (TPR) repeat protein
MLATPIGRSAWAGLLALSLALALPIPAIASPATGPTAEGPTTTASEPASEAEIQSALEAGDLTSARELAVARANAEPTAHNFALAAEVWLALGDYEQATAALDQALARLDPGPEADADRAALDRLRAEIETLARGTKPDEPASRHRTQIDRDRADRIAALTPKPEPIPAPIDAPAPRQPITKKWYFWVTLGAIVATAGAIVGVAVASGVEERNSDAASRQPAPAGGVMIRF